MSVLNQSGEEQVECPLCMEPLEVDDLNFYPCTCGYQICRFCWNRIREGENGLCPACRKAYPEDPADFTPLSQEQVAAIKTEKKAREQKRRNKTLESRRALANVRVVQNNLVFVVGLPVRLADPEILKRQEYFGKYGKIHKVVINQSTAYAGTQGPSASAYVTYVTSSDALRAIQGVNNVTLDGRVLKGSLGTTKYCAHFMKNQPCPKPDCMYLHELGDPKASFTKEEMHAGLHQVYERKLHNQLLARDEKQANCTGNSSTNPEKGSSKDGTQTNFIPTTVVTSSHINVVISSRSKNSCNGVGSAGSAGSGSGEGSSSSSSSGKEAWPSLGASPPHRSPSPPLSTPTATAAPAAATPSAQNIEHTQTVKSQETVTPDPPSPSQPTTKNNHDKPRNKDTNKKNKSEKAKKNGTSISENSQPEPETAIDNTLTSVFENETQQFLNNELDELESDRHSLLENHDLLDNSDHSLLEDDNTHNLLNDVNNEVLMMQRHRDMLAGLVDSNHLMPHMKTGMVNGYGLLDRDSVFIGNDRQVSQMKLEKEMLLRRQEMMMRERERELMARQHGVMMDKHFMPASSISLDSASDLLGANYHPNHNMLPFGMRVDNSMTNPITNSMATNSLSANSLNPLSNSMAPNLSTNHLTNSMSVNSLGGNSMSMNTMPGSAMPFLMHNQQLMQNQQQHQMQSGMVNGFDAQQGSSEGRYVSENMDKFFTDFNKAQQMRQMLGRDEGRSPSSNFPHNMLCAERLEMEHKQRMGVGRSEALPGGRAAGDGDDDLDFDPFKETQKALAEMMETEMMQNTVSSGDNMERVRRSRLPPPGFSHVGGFGLPLQQQRTQTHQQGNNGTSQQDWTQMDPAIMSTSVSYKPPQPQPPPLSHHHQELFARFNQLGVQQINAAKMNTMGVGGVAGVGVAGSSSVGSLWSSGHAISMKPWSGSAGRVPLPPGFAPPPNTPHHPQECIDAK